MRVYLDTNILVFLLYGDLENGLNPYVSSVLMDYETIQLTSSVCVHELIHLIQIGKLRRRRKEDLNKSALCTILSLEDKGISIVPTTEQHLKEYASLPLLGNHRDPFDRLIISQSMADHIPLISSDGNFPMYEPYGLQLIRNER